MESTLTDREPAPKDVSIESPSPNGSPAKKIESDGSERPTVREVCAGLVRHPYLNLVSRWNWKSALLSSLLRGTIFFFTNLISGWHAAVGAMLAELALRATTSGFYGSITESFSEARPAWAATAVAMVALPCLAHSMEFLVHWLRGTPNLGLSIGSSVVFTMFSTAFNLYVMRHGVLLTSRKNRTLGEDLTQIPPLVLSFLLIVPRLLLQVLFPVTNRKEI